MEDPELRGLVEAAWLAALALDAEGRIACVLTRETTLLGCDANDLPGRDPLALFHTGDLEPAAAALEAAGPTPRTLEVRPRNATGGPAWLEVTVVRPAQRGRTWLLCRQRRDTSAPAGDRDAQQLEAVAWRAGRIVHQMNNLLHVLRGEAEARREQNEPFDPESGALRHIEEAAEHGAALARQLRELAEARAADPRDPDVTAGGETVLIVDDSDEVRTLAARILGNHGYRVLEASNGGSASDLVRRQDEPIDLLLADLILEDESGLEVRDRIAELQPDIRSLFMSGFPDVLGFPTSPDEDAPMILAKPFRGAELIAAVRRALSLPKS